MAPLTTTFSLLLAIAQAAASLESLSPRLNDGDIQHVALKRTPRNKNNDMSRFSRIADNLRVKYNYKSPKPISKRGNTGVVSIINQNGDSSYYGPVSLGNPSQTFDVILDTGSADLWLTSTECTSCSTSTPAFDPTKSTTISSSSAGSQVQINYGSGSVAGTTATDTVSFGGFTIASQGLLVVDQQTPNLLNGDVAGILGLAFQNIAQTRALPFWQALANNNALTSPMMSFYLTRYIDDPGAQETEPGGYMTLGGTNSTFFKGSIEYINLTGTPRYWTLTLSGVTVQGKTVSVQGGNAALSAIDTGTTLIGGPSADVQAIWAAVPGSVVLTGQNAGFYAFPCNTTVSITMSFGGKAWPISSDDINLGRLSQGSSMCEGAIFDLSQGSNVNGGSGSGNPSWVVGDTFLKNVYSVFRSNPASVGFAELSDAAGGSSGTPGTATVKQSGSRTSSSKPTSTAPATSSGAKPLDVRVSGGIPAAMISSLIGLLLIL